MKEITMHLKVKVEPRSGEDPVRLLKKNFYQNVGRIVGNIPGLKQWDLKTETRMAICATCGKDPLTSPPCVGDPPQRYHQKIADRSDPCKHDGGFRFTGEIPCTGPRVCILCGVLEADLTNED